jgi:UDPglucose--hexose-1-phosphate uridylyltransferase
MSELRFDPIQKRWVIIASDRGKRPLDFKEQQMFKQVSFCPLCPGHEERTPLTIAQINDSEGNWRVRVVPNKFPALKIEGELEQHAEGIFDVINGIGAHEVVIESPNHNEQLPDMSVENVQKVLQIYRSRLIDLQRDSRLKYILIFKNYGVSAGASLEHPHSQIMATPITPRTVAGELMSAKEHYLLKQRCIFCDIIRQELKENKRVVYQDSRYVVLTPFASRFPFEMMIAPMPKRHSADFAKSTDDDLYHLAIILKDILQRLRKGLNDPGYNFLIHTAPNINANARGAHYWTTLERDFHWHIEIIPRLTKKAGFEWGTGFYINPTSPEDAAEYLRQIKI